jgi:hypothetical protein
MPSGKGDRSYGSGNVKLHRRDRFEGFEQASRVADAGDDRDDNRGGKPKGQCDPGMVASNASCGDRRLPWRQRHDPQACGSMRHHRPPDPAAADRERKRTSDGSRREQRQQRQVRPAPGSKPECEGHDQPYVDTRMSNRR